MIASIEVLKGSMIGQTFSFSRSITHIGRDPSNNIIFQDDTVSRNHAQIMQDGTQWRITNVSQKKQITINRRVVLQYMQEATIHEGDIILLGEEVHLCFHTVPIARSSPGTPIVPGHLKPTRQAGIPLLEVSTNNSPDKFEYPLVKPVMTIGRDPSNDIVIDVPIVSKFHAQIAKEGNQFVFTHPQPGKENTVNGLLHQGKHIHGDQPFRLILSQGDILRIGNEDGGLVTLAYSDGDLDSQGLAPQISEIFLGKSTLTVGRFPGNDVLLDHPLVSRYHAELRQEQSSYRVVDLNSTNHVYINGQQVNDYLISVDDEIRIGPFNLTYTGTTLTRRDESNGIRIEAYNLKKYGRDQVVLLNDISLVIPQRKFVAIVGGSGAGKSTLMKALSGFQLAEDGKVFYNGRDYYQQRTAFSIQIGYVPQDDIVHADLKVDRALYYAAKMRLPADTDEKEIQQRIDEVLKDVDLIDRRHLFVKDLSGGQRKRVSIALELLAKPSVFFLDEPTSGLDPGLDLKMMLLLRNLTDKGHTIILVTHATNNINYCDYVCFMAQGGRLAYFGPPHEARSFFGKNDFAEIYAGLEPTQQKKDVPEVAEKQFRTSPDYRKYVTGSLTQNLNVAGGVQPSAPSKLAKRNNRWKQFSVLVRRYIELLWNDKANLRILLLQAPIIGLILLFLLAHGTFEPNNVVQCPTTTRILTSDGVPDIAGPHNPVISTSCNRVKHFLTSTPQGRVYAAHRGGEQQGLQDFIFPDNGDAQKMLFIMAFAAIMFGCINAAREIVKELPIYRRERIANIGIAPYMFSKFVVLGALCLLQDALLILIVNWKAPLHQGILLPALPEVYITLVLTSLTGLMVGLAVSAIAPNTDRAMSFIPILLIPQVIFSGTLFPLNNWPLQIFGSIFAVRWAMAALGSSLGLHSDKLGGDTLFGNAPTYQGTLFSVYSQADASRYLILLWLALVGMLLLLSCIIAISLKLKDSAQ